MGHGLGETARQNPKREQIRFNRWCFFLLIAFSVPSFLLLNGCAGAVSGNAKQAVQAIFQLLPGSVNFGQVPVGKTTTQTVSVSNTGNTALNITQATVSNSQFSVTGLTTPLALAVGQTASITVGVNPTAAGTVTGTLTVQGDSGSSPVVANLSANAVSSPQGQLSVSPTSISFGTLSDGLKGTANLVLTNNGSGNLTVSMVTVTGSEFAISGITTPTTLSAGQSAQATVTFSPTSAGSATGSISIVSSDPNNPTLTVPLSGTGSTMATGQLTASPGSVSFGTIGVGSSGNQQIVLTNIGNAAVNVSALTVQGSGLAVTGMTAPATLNPSQSVTLTATFAPSAAGNLAGSITITSNATNSPVTIAVSGTGAQAGLTLSSTSYGFGSVVDGQTKSQSFTITSTGSAPLTIADLSVTGSAYSVTGLVTPTTLAAGSSTTFSVLFAPTTAGTLSGTVSITSNAPNSPNVLALSGTGTAASVALSASPTSVSFAGVNSGSSSSQNVTLTNSGNTSLTVSQVTVNAKDFSVSGVSNTTTIAGGASAVMSVTFSPTASENVTGNITVTSSQGATAVIDVSGSGLQPGIAVTPASESFGNVTVGSNSSQTIQLNNSGTGTLKITQVTVTGSGFSTSALTLPLSLNAGQSTSFSVQFSPTAAGSASGSVNIVSNAPSGTSVILLSGTGVAATQTLSFNTTSLAFGNVNTGSSSTQSVTVTNTGNANVTISQISESGPGFTLSGASVPVTLTPNQSTTFSVVFTPSAGGSDSGTVTVTSNATGSPTTIALSGTGAQAGLSVSPTSYNFGSMLDGQTKSQSFTVTNTGTASLTISQLSVTGSAFSVSGLTTPATVPAGGTTTFSVLFAPTTAGSLTGSVSITSNAPNSPNAVALSGTGTAATVTLSASPTSLSFTGINVGSSSSQNVTITNSGNTSLTISQVAVSAKDFTASGIANGLALGAGQSAVMSVSFSPTASENVTGNITVSSSQGSSAVITVTGGGVQPALTITPASASFGNTTVGSPSTQTIQLSNSGTGTLSITQVSVTGSGFSTSSLSLPMTLTTGQSSTFTLQFAPTAAGAVTGSLTVVSNAPNSPATIPLSGTGVAQTLVLSFSSTSLSFGTVNTGGSSTLSETITNTGNTDVQISQINESGSGFTLSGASVPVTLTPNQSTSFGVVFSPTATGTDNGEVTVVSNATGSPTTISLSGTGVLVSPPAGTPTFISEVSKTTTYTDALTTADGTQCATNAYCLQYADPTLSGNDGIVGFQYNASTAVTATVSDDKSSSYSCSTAVQVGTSGYWTQICWATPVTTGAHAVKISFASSVSQVKAKATTLYNAGAVDAAPACFSGSSSTTLNAGSITTTVANDFIYAFYALVSSPNPTSFAAGSGWTFGTTDIGAGHASEFQVDSSTGLITPVMTVSSGSASTYGECIVDLQASSGGTAPTGTYVARMMSWSPSGPPYSGVPINFQFPSSGNFVAFSCAAIQEPCTAISDSGNTWTRAPTGFHTNFGDAWYVTNAAADNSGVISVTIPSGVIEPPNYFFYDIVDAPSSPIVSRAMYDAGSTDSGTSMAINGTCIYKSSDNCATGYPGPMNGTNDHFPAPTSGFVLVFGQQAGGASVSVTTPASGCAFDSGNFGGMLSSGDASVDQNNPYLHCFYSSPPTTTYVLGQGTSLETSWSADLLGVWGATGSIGILNSAQNEGSGTTLAVTIPSARAGDLLAVVVGSGTAITKVCSDNTTCAAGHSFTHLTNSQGTGGSSQYITDIWYLLNALGGETTITINFTSSTSAEAQVFEVAKGGGGAWTPDGGNHTNNGANSGGIYTGPSVTPTSSADFCVSIFSQSGGQGATLPSPASGNGWVFGGWIWDNTLDGSLALITQSSSAQTPVWTAQGSNNFNASTGCFN